MTLSGPIFPAATGGAYAQLATLADGRVLRYRRMGAGGGTPIVPTPIVPTPIVMVHGFAGELLTWAGCQVQLSARHLTYALDLPGHGGSTRDLGAGGVPGLADALLAFLDAVGIGRAHMVGHSLGGAVVLQAALSHPGRAASLTLVAPAGLGEEVETAFIDRMLGAEDPDTLAAALRPLYADPGLVTRELGELVLMALSGPGVRATLRRLAGQCFAPGRQRLVLRGRLAELAVPVQLLWGTGDAVLPVRQAGGLPPAVAVHLFPGQGHMLPIEAPAEVSRWIDAIAAAG